MKVKIHTKYTLEIDGKEWEVSHSPDESIDPKLVKEKDGTFTLRYAVPDGDANNPLYDSDGNGFIYSSNSRHVGKDNFANMQKALGLNSEWEKDPELKPNPDTVALDCYEHGGIAWSVSGEGMNCEWDTASRLTRRSLP